jgi:hypothetical protein
LKKNLPHLPLTCKWIPTIFATLQTKKSSLKSVEDYDVDVRNIDNGMVDSRNNVVDKC